MTLDKMKIPVDLKYYTMLKIKMNKTPNQVTKDQSLVTAFKNQRVSTQLKNLDSFFAMIVWHCGGIQHIKSHPQSG